MDDNEQLFSEDDFILDQQNSINEPELFLQMPPASIRRKKKKLKKAKKSKKKKIKKKTQKKSSKKSSRNKKKVPKKIQKDKKLTIPVRLDQKMRSIGLLESAVDEPRKDNSGNENSIKAGKSSSSLIDEILTNQAKMCGPSNFLKINRDGTLEETRKFTHYMAKKNSKSLPKTMASNSNNNSIPPIDNIDTASHLTTLTSSSPIPITPVHPATSAFHNIPPPQTSLPPPPLTQQQSFLRQFNPSLSALLGPPPNRDGLFKGPPPNSLFNVPPPTVPLGLFNNIGSIPVAAHQPPPNSMGMLQQPNLLQITSQNLLNIFGVTDPSTQSSKPPPIAGLSESLLEQINKVQHNQQQSLAFKPPPPAPVPPPPLLLPPTTSSGSVDLSLIPPPPPPLHPNQQTSSRCGLDSPMDIEDDNAEADRNIDDVNKKILHCAKTKKRSPAVQIADELMKKSLKPYFVKRKITKEEYKDIMKRGVAKLSKRESLRPEKVEDFVKNYVNVVLKQRGGAKNSSRSPLHH